MHGSKKCLERVWRTVFLIRDLRGCHGVVSVHRRGAASFSELASRRKCRDSFAAGELQCTVCGNKQELEQHKEVKQIFYYSNMFFVP